jgi:hypothetical protein
LRCEWTELVTRKRAGQFLLSPRANPELARKAIELLLEITWDSWFTRGWTFEENYRAGDSMTILIPDPDNFYGRERLRAKPYL